MFKVVKFGIQSCVKFNDWSPKFKAQLVAYKRSKEVISSFSISFQITYLELYNFFQIFYKIRKFKSLFKFMLLTFFIRYIQKIME